MKPQNELIELKKEIQLTEDQAVKRDMLETFLDNRDKVLLLDSDSILYKVVNFWLDKDIDLNLMFEDFCTQVQEIVNTIEDDGFNIMDIQYYFTTCRNNFRHELTNDYKANRKDNPLRELASELMYHCIAELENLGLYVDKSDTLEADDLISIYVKEYGHEDSITCSIDKDLKQIVGSHFDYFKLKTGELDVFNEPIKEFKGWTFTTPDEGMHLFLMQMITGDLSDGVRGVNGVGKVGAAKLLDGKSNYGKLLAVARAYRIYGIIEDDKIKEVTKSKHDKHKGHREWLNNIDRVRLNVALMRL